MAPRITSRNDPPDNPKKQNPPEAGFVGSVRADQIR